MAYKSASLAAAPAAVQFSMLRNSCRHFSAGPARAVRLAFRIAGRFPIRGSCIVDNDLCVFQAWRGPFPHARTRTVLRAKSSSRMLADDNYADEGEFDEDEGFDPDVWDIDAQPSTSGKQEPSLRGKGGASNPSFDEADEFQFNEDEFEDMDLEDAATLGDEAELLAMFHKAQQSIAQKGGGKAPPPGEIPQILQEYQGTPRKSTPKASRSGSEGSASSAGWAPIGGAADPPEDPPEDDGEEGEHELMYEEDYPPDYYIRELFRYQEPDEDEQAGSAGATVGEGEEPGEGWSAGAWAAQQQQQEEVEAEGEEEEGEEEDLDAQFPRPPYRTYGLATLFAKAIMMDLAKRMEEEFPKVWVTGLQSDADKVTPGNLYFYMPTPEDEVFKEDDRHFPMEVTSALVNGAVALVVPKAMMPLPDWVVVPEKVPVMAVLDVEHVAQQVAVAFYDAPSRDLATVAVTGSYGKTTVSWLVRGILEQLDQVVGMIGTVEYALAEVRLDVDGNVWKPERDDPCEGRPCSAPFVLAPYGGRYTVPFTTPQGLHIQKLLAGMRDRGAQCVVAECSPQALSRNWLQWLDVNVVVWTNLSEVGGPAEVLAELGSREAVFQAHMELIDTLHDPTAQVAVINLDDTAAKLVRERAGSVPVVTYGIERKDADVLLQTVTYNLWETEMVVRTPSGRLQIITSLLGRHNVYNVLAAVATGIALRVPLKAIVAGIEAVELVPGRCEIIDVLPDQEFPVVVDAASTPESLAAIIKGAKMAGAKRVFTVFGCPGGSDRTQRARMAETAHNLSDYVIMTNDSPRADDPTEIIADMVTGLPEQVVNKFTSFVYNPFQDQNYVPLWFEPYLQKAQQMTKRYIMEDRFSAIRAAIGTAAPGDMVLITGRGHLDYVEHCSQAGDVVPGWFDDRREAAHALSKLPLLYGLKKMERKTLPWGNTLEEMDTVNVIDQLYKDK